MKISKLEIEWYRSIIKSEFNTSDLNVIIGRNNSGKSNILKSISDIAGRFSGGRDGIRFEQSSWTETLIRKENSDRQYLSFEFLLSPEEKELILGELESHGVGDKYLTVARETNSFEKISYSYERSSNGTSEVWETTLPNNEETVISDSEENLRYRGLPPKEINASNNSKLAKDALYDAIVKGFERMDIIESFREPKTEMKASREDRLSKTGDNLVKVLNTMSQNHPDQFARVEGTYVNIMEGVAGLRTPFVSQSGTKKTVVVDEMGYSDGFTLDEISAGSRQILTLITKIVKSRYETNILLIEEPELHLHPGAQQSIYDLIQEISSGDGPQIFLSTHSDVFVNKTDSSNIISVTRDIETQIKNVESNIDNLLNSLGYEKSEVLQSKAVVFVEGVSDKSVLEEFSATLSEQKPEFEPLDELGVTIHPLGGDRLKKHGGELHNSLSHLRIPHFFLTDSDDQSPEDKKDNLSEALDGAELRVLKQYSIESYLLENPYAIAGPLDLDIDEVREYINDNSSRPNKKSVLSDLFKDLAEREGGYDEREHSWIIAKNVNSEDIPEELVEIIERIQDLPN